MVSIKYVMEINFCVKSALSVGVAPPHGKPAISNSRNRVRTMALSYSAKTKLSAEYEKKCSLTPFATKEVMEALDNTLATFADLRRVYNTRDLQESSAFICTWKDYRSQQSAKGSGFLGSVKRTLASRPSLNHSARNMWRQFQRSREIVDKLKFVMQTHGVPFNTSDFIDHTLSLLKSDSPTSVVEFTEGKNAFVILNGNYLTLSFLDREGLLS